MDSSSYCYFISNSPHMHNAV